MNLLCWTALRILVKGLAGRNTVSFQSCNTRKYLRHRNFKIVANKLRKGSLFSSDASFYPVKTRRGYSFKSYNYPARTIRHKGFSMILQKTRAIRPTYDNDFRFSPNVKRTKATTCRCSTPGKGTAGKNQYKCTDGATAYCASTQMCYPTKPFFKARWSQACRTPRYTTARIGSQRRSRVKSRLIPRGFVCPKVLFNIR